MPLASVADISFGTGPVSVEISLLSPDGDTFGTPATTEVRSAAYARAAQGVVVGLFGILVLLLALVFGVDPQKLGNITEAQRLTALDQLKTMKFQPLRENIRAPHFVLWVRRQVEAMLEGETLARDDIPDSYASPAQPTVGQHRALVRALGMVRG